MVSKLLVAMLSMLVLGCAREEPRGTVITFPASAVGVEAELVKRQLDRFQRAHPHIQVELRRTPDAANQRHQLYVQWLNARAAEPDILQLDVVWTAEFAAAGWILPLDDYRPDVSDCFPATLEANRWGGRLHALPWFVDVGMLYYRSDLVPDAPTSFAELTTAAQRQNLAHGFLWQGARYEGLVCVFLEFLGGFGGRMLDERGRVAVDSDQAVRALTAMRDTIWVDEISPEAVLTWQEEQTRFGFQNGRAVFLRNWPYAFALMNDPAQSRVAGRFGVVAMPTAPGGSSTSTLGGSQLAINAHSRHPEAAFAVIEFLTQPEQMLERAREAGQFPPRRSLYDDPRLSLPVPPQEVLRIIERATPRPVMPLYAEFSDILQIWLHRALTRQTEPAQALREAARELRLLLKQDDPN